MAARDFSAIALILLAAAGFGSFCSTQSTAATNDPAAAIQEHLQNGEFAPARRMAERIDHRTERDRQLTYVAVSQGKAGGHYEALETISLISDDRARAEAIKTVNDNAQQKRGAAGGNSADFQSLMDLITTTIKPESWDEVGGPGAIQPFRTGVHVDADGVLRRVVRTTDNAQLALVVRENASPRANSIVSQPSALRKISLPRLEKAVQLRIAAGQRPTEEMQLLAGLEKIRYVMVYPETGDLVIAGPAGDWKTDNEGRVVSLASGRPVLHLDDAVVILRHLSGGADTTFGCSITPTQESLAKTKAFAEESAKKPLRSGAAARDAWLGNLRNQLGRQKIEVFGIDPRTRVGQVLVEADYRMKLVGMGLEPGTIGVTSYLDSVKKPAPMDVLRWWFTMNYRAVLATPENNGFELRGTGVQVLSENEMLDKSGEQIHTGASSALNQEFAQSFTANFKALAEKYPVYADLQNLFDLALVSALVHGQGLADQVNWHMTCFGAGQPYQVTLGAAPQEVDTVMNHRVLKNGVIVVGVSGGVHVDPWQQVKPASFEKDKYGKLEAEHAASAAKRNLESKQWWWD